MHLLFVWCFLFQCWSLNSQKSIFFFSAGFPFLNFCFLGFSLFFCFLFCPLAAESVSTRDDKKLLNAASCIQKVLNKNKQLTKVWEELKRQWDYQREQSRNSIMNIKKNREIGVVIPVTSRNTKQNGSPEVIARGNSHLQPPAWRFHLFYLRFQKMHATQTEYLLHIKARQNTGINDPPHTTDLRTRTSVEKLVLHTQLSAVQDPAPTVAMDIPATLANSFPMINTLHVVKTSSPMCNLTCRTHHSHIFEMVIRPTTLEGEVTMHNPNKAAQAILLQRIQCKTTTGDHRTEKVSHRKQQS